MAQETMAVTAVPGPVAPVTARWIRVAGAVAAGLLMFLAFPPNPLGASDNGLWPLAPVAVAVFTLTMRGLRARSAAWLGLLTGLVFFLALLDWARVIGPDAWAGLSLLEAAYLAPLGAAVAVVTRLRWWPVWTAALWVGEEYVRSRWPFGGLPWGRLAFAETASPLTPYASLGGAPLVSFVTALIGALLALACLSLSRGVSRTVSQNGAGNATAQRVVGGLAVAGAVGLGVAGMVIPTPTDGRQVTVAVIQGNVPRSGLDFLGQREAVLDNHIRATMELADEVRQGKVPKPELVIWPENSSDLDPYADPVARAKIDATVTAIGVPVLVGAVVEAPDGRHVQNRGIVWDPTTGMGAYYTKRHPVPFGEYIPFRSLLTKIITRFERIPQDFQPGTWPGIMQ
ncbi:MAG TPA: apolipoprotein N-acyltransferase, partial [Streptosporangiaceae bacterium]|nr:apolipoprotein N-acyltransferase [Streptosporangiaceae bacterium]